MPYELPNDKYPFPLNFLASDGGTDLTAFVQGDATVLPASTNWYVFCLTPDQLQDVRTLVDVGAPIAFPDTYISIQQLFWQLFEFPNQIPQGSCMDLCQLILDCINTTPALQQAIAGYSIGSSIPSNQPVDANIAGSNVLIENVGCANDNVFGMTTGIADLFNNLAVDIIEKIVAQANIAGRLGDLVEAIPLVGELPVDDALQFLESFIDDMAQNYQAQYTVALRDQIRCDLFCLARDDCDVTFQEIFDYFNGQLTNSVTLSDALNLIVFMNTGIFTGVQLVWAWHTFLSGLLMMAGEVIGIDSAKLIQMVSALFNDPDPDWATLCSTCAWSGNWLNGNGDPTVDGWVLSFGVYDAVNQRLNGTFNNVSSDSVYASFFIPAGKTGTLTKFSVAYDIQAQQNVRTQRIQFIDEFGVQVAQDDITLQSGVGTLTFTGSFTYQPNWEIRLFLAEDNRVNPHYSRALSILVEGTGDNPFI